MIRLKTANPFILECSLMLSDELIQKLNCAAGTQSGKVTLTPKQLMKIIRNTPNTQFNLRCFMPSSVGGSSSASQHFYQALQTYNQTYGTNIDDPAIIQFIKDWCSQHGYNESQSKVGVATGGKYDNKNLFIYKVPMQALFKKKPDGRGTVMDGPMTFGRGLDHLYIKLSVEKAGDPIDVVSFHRDSDAGRQRAQQVAPRYKSSTYHKPDKIDETKAGEGMLDESPEKSMARATYEKDKK